MNSDQKPEATGIGRVAAYTTPELRRLGSATELTRSRLMVGAMDGGANNTRTG